MNRLKPLLNQLISPKQIGFLEGKNFFDGIVLVQEVVHFLISKMYPSMMIKLNFSKAYDRLNLDFLLQV